jgi:hypothetical protein
MGHGIRRLINPTDTVLEFDGFEAGVYLQQPTYQSMTWLKVRTMLVITICEKHTTAGTESNAISALNQYFPQTVQADTLASSMLVCGRLKHAWL